MDYSFYDGSILLIIGVVDSFLEILAKIASSPVADTVADARIHETMLPFSFQVKQVISIITKVVADATGSTARNVDIDLSSIPAIIAFFKEIQAELAVVERETVNKRQHDLVAFPLGPTRPVVQRPIWQYVQGYAIPNIFFHATTAYDIARKEGVDLGKKDYLFAFAWKYYEAQPRKVDE